MEFKMTVQQKSFSCFNKTNLLNNISRFTSFFVKVQKRKYKLNV